MVAWSVWVDPDPGAVVCQAGAETVSADAIGNATAVSIITASPTPAAAIHCLMFFIGTVSLVNFLDFAGASLAPIWP
jgi:hypothetical protein